MAEDRHETDGISEAGTEPPERELRPRILKVKRLTTGDVTRREMLQRSGAAVATIATTAVAGSSTACFGEAEYEMIMGPNGRCNCHMVCSCNNVSGADCDTESRMWEARWSGDECTCHTVCSCDTVIDSCCCEVEYY